MQIVQSFWSGKKDNILQTNFGWLAPEYNAMSWALSCLQLQFFYRNVYLYADSLSAKFFIDSLGLPYADVICSLDNLNDYHADLWALPKIYTYSKQEAPFLHIDGDVYIWKAFENKLLDSGLIAQNQEAATEYYENKIQYLEKNLTYFPVEIAKERNDHNPIYAYNAGIFGGTDINFFKYYTHTALDFVNNNKKDLSKINISDFNIFFEQYLFYCIAKNQNKKINVLINNVIGDNEYKGFGDFSEVPHNKQYLHLLGVYKRDPGTCLQLANRLRQDYPEYYYRIISLFKKGNIPLVKDYYYSVKKVDEQDLLLRYDSLKKEYTDNVFNITNKSKRNIELSLNKYIPVKSSLIEKVALQNIQLSDGYKLLLKDIEHFERSLMTIILSKFNYIPTDYLYARDISCTQYFQRLFENRPGCDQEMIVRDGIAEIIQSCFDWSKIDQCKIIDEAIIESQLLRMPANIYTAIIPECDVTGYSLINIDELDVLLLETLHRPFTIKQVLNEIKPAFDEEDLNNSLVEFELLIIGRIKYALQHKMIKCV